MGSAKDMRRLDLGLLPSIDHIFLMDLLTYFWSAIPYVEPPREGNDTDMSGIYLLPISEFMLY